MASDHDELAIMKEERLRLVDEIKQHFESEVQELKSLLRELLDSQRALASGWRKRNQPVGREHVKTRWLLRQESRLDHSTQAARSSIGQVNQKKHRLTSDVSKLDLERPAAICSLEEQLANHMLDNMPEAVFKRSSSDPCEFFKERALQTVSDGEAYQTDYSQRVSKSNQLLSRSHSCPALRSTPSELDEGAIDGSLTSVYDSRSRNAAPPSPVSANLAPSAPEEALPILPLPHVPQMTLRDEVAASPTFARQVSRLDALRQVHETERVQQCQAMVDNLSKDRPEAEQLQISQKFALATSRNFLRLTGVLPLCSGCLGYVYPASLITCCTCASAFFAQKALFSSHPAENGLRALEVLGAGLALMFFHLQGASKLFRPHQAPLHNYAIARNIYSSWASRVAIDAIIPALFFLLDLSPLLLGCDDSQSLAASVVSGLLLTATLYCTHHMCTFMSLTVDEFAEQQFCCGVDAELGVVQWNLVQALLNQAAKKLEGSLMVTITVSWICVIPVATEILSSVDRESRGDEFACHMFLHSLPKVSLRLVMCLFTLFKAAEVTEKCNRSICFINSLQRDSGPILDQQRSFLVRHMTDSGAGFYIRGVKVTSLAFMKMLYGTGALMAAILSRGAEIYKQA